MKSLSIGIFLNKSTRWQRLWYKIHQIKKRRPLWKTNFLSSTTLHFIRRMIRAFAKWFVHLKRLKNAPCFWIGCFSSCVKRCIHVCLQRFTRELKRPNQRQGPFLGHLECSNHPGTKVQSWRSQKVGITEWRRFFDSMQFAYAQCPLVGFICRKELLQQNGPQGQN